MDDSYMTIKESATGVYKEKGSKFLAFGYPVKNEKEALIIINSLRKEFYDAKHHCYAYSLGAKGKYYRTFDAGEPRHSAGDQILNQIRSFKVSDILVVVIRYFGGTKLGISGLNNAYKSAAKAALANADRIEKILVNVVKITFHFDGLNDVMRLINLYNIQVIDQNYEMEGCIRLKVRNSELSKIKGLFETLPQVREVKILPGGS